MPSHLLGVSIVQYLNVLEELYELLFDLGLLGELLDVIVGGILDAALEQLEIRGLLPHKRVLVNQLHQQVGTVEALS